MNRPSAVLVVLLLGAGLILIGPSGPSGGSALAQSGAGKTKAAGKAVKAGRGETKRDAQNEEDKDDEEDADGAAAKPAAGDAEGVLAGVMKRPEAIQGLTRRGQSITDAPPFVATEREPELEFFPCADCHEDQEPNPKVRKLKDEHTSLDFQHGGGRFWCYDACHNKKDMNHLVSLHGEPIGYDEAYKLCGQCHFQRQKDWFFGGHGKRAGTFAKPREIPVDHSKIDFSKRGKIGTWKSTKRVLTNCPACHNAHSPSIKPYKPSPPPQVRKGLTRHAEQIVKHEQVWEVPEPTKQGGAK